MKDELLKPPSSIGNDDNVVMPAEAVEGGADISTPKRGSVLEGRVRALLHLRGFQTVTNKKVLDHEIDVWGEDDNHRVVLVECKEFYDGIPISASHIRNFFGKVYDIEHNYGENVYLAMFVSISGFTDPARALCERLGIFAVDYNTLELLEQSLEEIAPRHSTLEDQTVIELRKQRDKLSEEISKRNLVRRLAQQIEYYERTLQTKTLPSFLVPSSISTSFWLSNVEEIPFVGLNGTFKDFTVPAFPYIAHVIYEQRRIFGHKRLCVSTEYFEMQNGVIQITGTNLRDISAAPTEDAQPLMKELIGKPVLTLDEYELGTVADILISYRKTGWAVEAIKVSSSKYFKDKLTQPEFSIPGERISLREGMSWQLVAHLKVALELANHQF